MDDTTLDNSTTADSKSEERTVPDKFLDNTASEVLESGKSAETQKP